MRRDVGRVGIGRPGIRRTCSSRSRTRRIRRDQEDELVDRRLAAPIVRIGLEADDGVLVVADELERPGADRGAVELLAVLPARSLSAYSLERIEAKSMARSAMNGASARVSVNLTVASSTRSTDLMSSGIDMPAKYGHSPPA